METWKSNLFAHNLKANYMKILALLTWKEFLDVQGNLAISMYVSKVQRATVYIILFSWERRTPNSKRTTPFDWTFINNRVPRHHIQHTTAMGLHICNIISSWSHFHNSVLEVKSYITTRENPVQLKMSSTSHQVTWLFFLAHSEEFLFVSSQDHQVSLSLTYPKRSIVQTAQKYSGEGCGWYAPSLDVD